VLLLLLMILLPQSNLEMKSKSMIKSKRQGVSPNSMAVRPCSEPGSLEGGDHEWGAVLVETLAQTGRGGNAIGTGGVITR
jgi:hypothetical protein